MGAINIIKFRKDLGQAKNSLKNIAFNAASAKFISKRDQLFEDFDDHEVTKELDAGATASNNTLSLGGYGNLFSFLGFEAGDKPTEIVRKALNIITQINQEPTIEEKGNRWLFKFYVIVPSLERLYSITPMTWDTKSWIKAIEKGVSNFHYYLYNMEGLNRSRSGTGLQIKNILHGGEFKPQEYISKILSDFRKKLE